MSVETVMGRLVWCLVCGVAHHERLLCDKGRAILDAYLARHSAQAMNIDYGELVPAKDLGIGGRRGDRIIADVSVHSGVFRLGTEEAPVLLPSLILTGSDRYGRHVPTWMIPGRPPWLRALGEVVVEMTEKAIKLAES